MRIIFTIYNIKSLYISYNSVKYSISENNIGKNRNFLFEAALYFVESKRKKERKKKEVRKVEKEREKRKRESQGGKKISHDNRD